MSSENRIDMEKKADNYYYNPTWENWTLYNAIPTTLTIAAGIAGGYFVGNYFGNQALKAQVNNLKSEVQTWKSEVQAWKNIGLRITDLEQIIGLSQETNQELIAKLNEGFRAGTLTPIVREDREHVEVRHVRFEVEEGEEGEEGEEAAFEHDNLHAAVGEYQDSEDNPMPLELYRLSKPRDLSEGAEALPQFSRLASDVASPMISGEKASEQYSSHVAPQASSSSAAGTTPARENPFVAKRVLNRTPAAKAGGDSTQPAPKTPAAAAPKTPAPKTPSKPETLTKTQKMLKDIDEAEGLNVSVVNVKKDITKFLKNKFSNNNGYNTDNRKVLKDALLDKLQERFERGSEPDQIYKLLNNIFHGGALSISSDTEEPAQFTEIFDKLKEGTDFSGSPTFEGVDERDPFNLNEEDTAEILTYQDVNSAYMFYLSKVIAATIVVAQTMPTAEAYEMNLNESMISEDFDDEDLSDIEDEASDVEITAQVESEQNSIVIEVEEPLFTEKFISLLPWYGEIVATSAASSALKVSTAIAWRHLTHDAASAVVEMILPKDSVMGVLATSALDMAVFEAIYGQAEIAFNYVCAAPEALEIVGQEGIAYSA